VHIFSVCGCGWHKALASKSTVGFGIISRVRFEDMNYYFYPVGALDFLNCSPTNYLSINSTKIAIDLNILSQHSICSILTKQTNHLLF